MPLTDDNKNHAKELDPRAQQGAEDHGILRRPEDVAVDVLPARLLHGVLLVGEQQGETASLFAPQSMEANEKN